MWARVMYSAAQHAVHLGLDSISPGGALNTPADSNGIGKYAAKLI